MECREDAWRTTKGYVEENAQESTREKKDVMIKKSIIQTRVKQPVK